MSCRSILSTVLSDYVCLVNPFWHCVECSCVCLVDPFLITLLSGHVYRIKHSMYLVVCHASRKSLDLNTDMTLYVYILIHSIICLFVYNKFIYNQ